MKHFGIYEDARKIVVYHAGQAAMVAEEDWQLIQLADQCMAGQLVLPVSPEPVTIYDQRWLLRLASEALAMAAEVWRG